MSFEGVFLSFVFLGFGFLSSAGVFTVFVTVGIVPRLADKTKTAKHIMVYENAIMAGAVLGCILSVFPVTLRDLFPVLFLQDASSQSRRFVLYCLQ